VVRLSGSKNSKVVSFIATEKDRCKLLAAFTLCTSSTDTHIMNDIVIICIVPC
jgi:hypothetical protein